MFVLRACYPMSEKSVYSPDLWSAGVMVPIVMGAKAAGLLEAEAADVAVEVLLLTREEHSYFNNSSGMTNLGFCKY